MCLISFLISILFLSAENIEEIIREDVRSVKGIQESIQNYVYVAQLTKIYKWNKMLDAIAEQ